MKNTKDVLIYGKHPVELAIQNPHRTIKEIYATKQTLNEMNISKNI